MADSYQLFSGTLARVGIRRAFLLNAEFEDHAEHTYAELVRRTPSGRSSRGGRRRQRVRRVPRPRRFDCWADVFRRIGLDERDHRNASFAFAGMPEQVVPYEGMPPSPGPEEAARPEPGGPRPGHGGRLPGPGLNAARVGAGVSEASTLDAR